MIVLPATTADRRSRRRTPHHRPTRRRRGLTLLEVLVSLAIFLGSLVGLGQLISTGSSAASKAQLQTQAVLRCESKLAELVASFETLQATDETAFDDDDLWSWSVTYLDSPHVDLLSIEVRVTHKNSVTGDVNAEYSLQRLIRDPQLYLDAAAEEAEAAAEAE